MLAIVIPYFKLTFFEETLLCLANQTNKNFKVYIGNDASPESPLFLIEKFKDKFDFVYYEFETNLGGVSLVQQWNRCIAKVEEEEWLMILGDDDVLDENVVEEFYKNILEINHERMDVIRYATVVINEKGETISKVHVHPKFETTPDFLMRKFRGGTRSTLSEFVFRKTAFDLVGFKDLPLAWWSDYLAVMEVSKFSTMFTINNSLVYFRLSGINITSKKDDYVLKRDATFKFYHYLLGEKKQYFNTKELKILNKKIEDNLLASRSISLFLKFSSLYVMNCYVKEYFQFFGRVILLSLKKIK